MAMMKKYSVALCGACALLMSSLVWSNDAAPAAKADTPVAIADTAASTANQSSMSARKKKGRAAKKAAQNAADAAPSAAAEQAKRIRVRQRGELASAVDAVQSGQASTTEKHAADTHATTSNADHSQKTTTASVVSDGRASAVMEDRYMPVTKSVEAPAVEQSSYSLLDRHPAEYVKPAGEMASREAEPLASRAEPARVEAPTKVAVAETRQAVEPVAAAPAPSPTPAAEPVREAINNVQDSVLACNPPLKSEVAALFDRWNASLRTGDPKKVVANYAPYSVLLPTVSNRARFTAAEKEDYFKHFLERKPEGKIDDRAIEVDCNSATDSGLYTFRFVDGTSVRARYSFSYKRVGNDWLISSHHSSGMPEQPPKVVVQAVEEKVVEKPAPKKAVERSENFQRPDGWVRFP
jgi:uncharacterized protein (TIGR02246 family)